MNSGYRDELYPLLLGLRATRRRERQAARSARCTGRSGRRPKPHAVVLMYHRVAECEIDPWNLCVSPQRFAEHLEALKRSYSIVAMRGIGGHGVAAKRRRHHVR